MPNDASSPSGRNLNSPGCPAYRQPLLCTPICALHRHLTLTASALTLALLVMQTSPYPTIQQIAEGIRSKEFSPIEILDAHFKRIDSCEPKLNAFVHLDPHEARVQASVRQSDVLR